MPKTIKVFVSSKMQELRPERDALAESLPQLSGPSFQIKPWIFEADAAASAQSIRQVYRQALDESDLYIGIFWNQYGQWTIDEFHRAGELGIPRHIYVKQTDPEQREPRLTQFLNDQADVRFGITPRWFTDVEDLCQQIDKSVEQWLQEQRMAYYSSITAIVANMGDDIPDVPRKLFGRDELVKKVETIIDRSEHGLLRGLGGSGKTALAATCAANHIDDGKGRVIWITTGAAESSVIFEAIARAFNCQKDWLLLEPAEQIAFVRRLLVNEQISLVVLDDVWNSSALAVFMKALPRRMPLLVTSRQRYPLDEIIEVGELAENESRRLLEYHARQDLSQDVNTSTLIDLLGHHAFALEIAGKTMKVYGMTPGELLQSIEKAPHDLHMPAGFGDIGREGVKTLIDTSIDALTKPLYDVFVALGSLFDPATTAELIRRILTEDSERVAAQLEDLTKRGLVTLRSEKSGIKVYGLHNLVYSYARTLYINRDEDRLSIVRACLAYAQDFAADLPRLDAEIGNLMETVEYAQETHHPDMVVSLMQALAVDGPYFAARGYTSQSLTLLQVAAKEAKNLNDLTSAHYLYSKLGNAYANFLGRLDDALIAYQEALELACRLEDTRREAILLTVIGTVRFRQGESDSDSYHDRAEVIAREQADRVVLCQVLHNRGAQAVIDRQNPNYELARRLSDEAAQLAAQHDLPHLYFYSMLNRGASEHELKQFDQALVTHQQAYDFAVAQQNNPWMAEALHSIGEDHHELNERPKAQAAFQQALALYEESGTQTKIEALSRYMQDNDYLIEES